LITQEEVDESFNINRNDISLYGLNRNVSGDMERSAETTIYSKIVVNYNTQNIVISGFAFTDSGQIEFSGKNDNVNISNNYFYDSNLNSETFVVSESYEEGIIQFYNTSKMSDNIVIENNYFSNIDQVGINYQDVQNIKVLNNKFEDFDYDAVRSTDTEPTNNSQWVFKDNSFINGKYNGLMFMSYGSNPEIGLVQFLSIYNNYFENVGTQNDLFSNAISFNNYNEGVTNINISYNTLKNCDNYILLRNNAISSNQSKFFGYINYNEFIGEPNSFYVENKNVTDTEDTNKKQIMLSNNFFSDEVGNSITPQDSMFDGVIYNSDIIVNANILDNIGYIYGQNISYIGGKCQMTSNEDVTWSTSDSSKATVSSDGLVTCLDDGNVTITATNSNGYQTHSDLIIGEECTIDYAALLISVAMQEEGYQEKSDGYSKYGGWYAEQVSNSVYATGDWCAMFVSWCANQAGISTNTILRYASVSAGRSWFEAKGLFEYKEDYIPKPGDILIFKSDGASHTGIVVKVEGNTLYTIEGNTSDMVAQRNYDLTNCSRLTGYGTPDYSGYNESNMTFDVSGSTSGEGLSTK
ncbi:MAG: CHAP domain-containing protein, partial [Bacilli bacterium]